MYIKYSRDQEHSLIGIYLYNFRYGIQLKPQRDGGCYGVSEKLYTNLSKFLKIQQDTVL
jgi:hypothetical protein